MEAKSFVYWLQGMFELCDPKTLDENQTTLIKSHLAMVFKHEIDPALGTPEHREELQKIHEGEHPPLTHKEIHKLLEDARVASVPADPFGPKMMC